MKKILGDTRLMLKCCVMYYENEMGQNEIAQKLGISRPTVSKLLKEAKERGYLRIEIVGPQEQNCYKLERELEEKFGLKEAIVVEDMTTHSNQLVVELSKGMGGKFKLLHGPAIVSNENIINILRQDKNIKDVFKAMDKMNIAVVGIGSPIDENSNVIKNGYFNSKDIETFKERKAAGDICLNVYDIDGNIQNYEYNKCVFGMNIEKLRDVDKVVGIACGIEKLNAVIGAINGNYVNVLAVNYSLAKALLDYQL